MDLNYTITKFDNQNKFVVVTFEDGTWAEIRLRNPLPKTKEELENLIKRYAAPEEAVLAISTPDADLSFIDSLVGITETTTRFSIEKEKQALKAEREKLAQESGPINDPRFGVPLSRSLDELVMWENVQFEQNLGDALVKFGLLKSNPTKINVSEL
jgi:hypothetical protein